MSRKQIELIKRKFIRKFSPIQPNNCRREPKPQDLKNNPCFVSLLLD